MELVPGYRFCPTDEELVLDYLLPKVNGLEVPGVREGNCPIFDFNLYEIGPEDVWDKFKRTRKNDLKKNKDLYFFTTLTRKSAKGSRFNRTVGPEGTTGTWKGEDSSKTKFSCGSIIGSRKRYRYGKGRKSEQDIRWIMHEFDLEQLPLTKPNNEENKTVLCILRKNDDEANKKRKHGDIKEEEIMLGYDMDLCDDDEYKNFGVMDNKQTMLTQEKRQCILPINIDHNVPPPPPLVQPSEAYGLIGADDELQQYLMQFIDYENIVIPQIPLEAEPGALHNKENRGLQQWFMSDMGKGTPPSGSSTDQLLKGKQNWGQQSFMSCVDDVQALAADHHQSAYGKHNWGQQCFVPSDIDNAKPLAADNGSCALQQEGENYQVQNYLLSGTDDIEPQSVAQMHGTLEVEQIGVNDNVASESMTNNTVLHTASVPTYGTPAAQNNLAGSSNVMYGGSNSVNDGFRYTPWAMSFGEELLRINCCPKFS